METGSIRCTTSKTHQRDRSGGEFSPVVNPSSASHPRAVLLSWSGAVLQELSVQFEVLRNAAGIMLNCNCNGLWCRSVAVDVGSESRDDVAWHSQDAARRSSLATDQVARQGRETAPVWGARHGFNAAQSRAVSSRHWWVCQPRRVDDDQLSRCAETHQRRPKICQVFVQRSGTHFVFSFCVVCSLYLECSTLFWCYSKTWKKSWAIYRFY